VPWRSDHSEGEHCVGNLLEAGDVGTLHIIDIAAVAWEGFQFSGPGGVCLREVEGEPRIAYHPGAVCNCHPVDAATYDPQRQVIIFTTDCKPVLLEGWPTPPEALKLFDVEIEELIRD